MRKSDPYLYKIILLEDATDIDWYKLATYRYKINLLLNIRREGNFSRSFFNIMGK